MGDLQPLRLVVWLAEGAEKNKNVTLRELALRQ